MLIEAGNTSPTTLAVMPKAIGKIAAATNFILAEFFMWCAMSLANAPRECTRNIATGCRNTNGESPRFTWGGWLRDAGQLKRMHAAVSRERETLLEPGANAASASGR